MDKMDLTEQDVSARRKVTGSSVLGNGIACDTDSDCCSTNCSSEDLGCTQEICRCEWSSHQNCGFNFGL